MSIWSVCTLWFFCHGFYKCIFMWQRPTLQGICCGSVMCGLDTCGSSRGPSCSKNFQSTFFYSRLEYRIWGLVSNNLWFCRPSPTRRWGDNFVPSFSIVYKVNHSWILFNIWVCSLQGVVGMNKLHLTSPINLVLTVSLCLISHLIHSHLNSVWIGRWWGWLSLNLMWVKIGSW